jgi:hypothetical protein
MTPNEDDSTPFTHNEGDPFPPITPYGDLKQLPFEKDCPLTNEQRALAWEWWPSGQPTATSAGTYADMLQGTLDARAVEAAESKRDAVGIELLRRKETIAAYAKTIQLCNKREADLIEKIKEVFFPNHVILTREDYDNLFRISCKYGDDEDDY